MLKKICISILFLFFTVSFANAQVGGTLTSTISYPTSADFLKAEGDICEVATDGCNTITIVNGQLGASTMMYCQDVYGSGAQEKWSCKDFKKIGGDEDEHGCKLGAGYSWNAEKKQCTRSWEDKQEQEAKICTMDYTPVCAKVQVQCIKAPCLPVAETFGNACMAGENEILYSGECDEYVDLKLFSKLKAKYPNIQTELKDVSTSKLEKAVQNAVKIISNTKLLRIVREMQVNKITKLYFLKSVIENEITSRLK